MLIKNLKKSLIIVWIKGEIQIEAINGKEKIFVAQETETLHSKKACGEGLKKKSKRIGRIFERCWQNAEEVGEES